MSQLDYKIYEELKDIKKGIRAEYRDRAMENMMRQTLGQPEDSEDNEILNELNDDFSSADFRGDEF